MPFEHYCHCGDWGSFGYGRPGSYEWRCQEHRLDWQPYTQREKYHRFRCVYCQLPIDDPSATGIAQWTSGWAISRRGGGTNSISLPKRHPHFAHKHCVEREVRGYTGQHMLFDPPEKTPA